MINQNQKFDLNYITQGQGPPVILIHGMAASRYDWEALAPDLSAAGYRSYALDLLGHGESAKPEDPELYHSRAIYAVFERWLESLKLGEPLILVGHSMGGYLSLKYSLRNPQKMRGMVLLNPFYSPRQLSPIVRLLQRRPRIGEKALRIAPQWLVKGLMAWDPVTGGSFPPEARQQIAADLKRASPHIMYIPRTIRDLTPKLARIHHPALVLWGDKDLTLYPASFPRLVKALPNAEGQVVAGCGHQPHIGKPQIVNHLILDFLKSIPLR